MCLLVCGTVVYVPNRSQSVCMCMLSVYGGWWYLFVCVCASVWVHGGHLCISMVSRLFGECQRSFELSFRICVRLVSGCVRLSQNIIQNMCVRCGCMAAICVLAWYIAYSVNVGAPSNYHSGFVCVWCLVVSGFLKTSFRICVRGVV